MHTNIIRSLAIGISILGTFAFGAARIAFAQAIGQPIAAVPPFQLDFDEAGNSLLNGLANPNQVTFVAGGGIQFYLPGIVQPGQVLINSSVDVDPLNPSGDSDLLTFSNGPDINGLVTGIMLYESLLDPFDPILAADVPRLNYLVPIVSIGEIGPEGNNGFSYIVPGAIYNGISDGQVPEPSTFVMGGLGLLSLTALAYRRRRAHSRN
jgi:MYXO-CTERM domain-containing protein